MSESWREVGARAAFDADRPGQESWEEVTEGEREWYRNILDAILAALAEAGPDETMIEAARLAEMKHEATPREELLLTDPSLRTWVYERSRAGLTAALRSATQEGKP